MDDREDILKM